MDLQYMADPVKVKLFVDWKEFSSIPKHWFCGILARLDRRGQLLFRHLSTSS
jgi:hypothetical protein